MAYIGKWDSGGAGGVFWLKELVGKGSKYGFELCKWDSRWVWSDLESLWLTDCSSTCGTPTPIIDTQNGVISVCAGHPDDLTWDKMHQDGASELDQYHQMP